MKKFLIILSVLIFSSGLLFGQSNTPDFKVRKAPQKENIVIDTLAKNYIAAYMERNEGRFTIKARQGNRNLLYGGILTGGAVYTSHANFKIGDQLFTMRPSLYGAQKVTPRTFDNDNNKLSVTYYECDGVEIRQELIPRENTAKKAGAVLIKYVFKNNSGTTKWVGAALKLDTYIGGQDNITGNDSARLSTPIGIIRNQQEIYPVTDYWLAFENIQDTSALIGRGTLKGKDLVFPDFMYVGNYEQLTQYKYDEPILSGGPYFDSEILMRWKQVQLAPGESTYFSTLYGMGEIDYQGNTLSLYCSSPFDTLSMDANSNYEVNPFDYLVSVRNPGLTINNVKATIRLNNKTFFLQNPADSVRYLGELAGGEQKLATWKIYTKNQCSNKDELIRVEVTGESSDTNFCVTQIYVPANRLYTLNLSADPVSGGMAEKFPNKTKYECDIPVTITATPNTGYKFIGWEGDFSGDKMQNPKTFYMDTDRSIVAKFMVDSFNLDVRVSPLGAGKIIIADQIVQDGIYRFRNGTNVPIAFIPDKCYNFDGWSGDTTIPKEKIDIVVNIWKNRQIVLNFKKKTYSITGGVVGNGTIDIIPPSQNSDGKYNCGDSITLIAKHERCYNFGRWEYTAGNESGTIEEAIVGFRIYSDIIGTAYFNINKYSLKPTINVIGSGNIIMEPYNTDSLYDCDAPVKLTVNPDMCFKFIGWADGNIDNPRNFIMNKNEYPKAILEKKKFTLYASTDYEGSGLITPDKDTLFCGDTSSLTITTNCPYSFVKWNDGALTISRKVYMNENKNFIAIMAKITFEVTKAEPNIFPNIVVDLKVDSVLLSQNPVLVPALNPTQFKVFDEDSLKVQKSITNFNLIRNGNTYQIIYSLYGKCYNKATDLSRKTLVKFMYNNCEFESNAKYKINPNSGCDSCSRMLKRKTPDALFANRPNPFNPETRIKYSIENSDKVDLVVYDVLGREVAVLVNEYKEAGEYEVTFSPKGLPSGVYLYRIKTNSFQDVKKMIYLK